MIGTIDSTVGRLALLALVWATAYAAASATRPAKPMLRIDRVTITRPLEITSVERWQMTGIGTSDEATINLTKKHGTARFGEVWIANEADEPQETATARQLAAHISFFSSSGAPLGEPMRYGRWAEQAHPTERQHLAELSVTELPPNGIAKALNVALKPTGDSNCYGFSNATILHHPKGYVDKPRVLVPGLYFVRIRLRGINVRCDVWLKLDNPGDRSDGFTIEKARRQFPLARRAWAMWTRAMRTSA